MQEPALARAPRHFERVKCGPCRLIASSWLYYCPCSNNDHSLQYNDSMLICDTGACKSKKLTLGGATLGKLLLLRMYCCYTSYMLLQHKRHGSQLWPVGHSTCHSSKAFHACHRSGRLVVRARTYIVACTLARSRTGTAPNAVPGIINLAMRQAPATEESI
jgi:hypothetical protein